MENMKAEEKNTEQTDERFDAKEYKREYGKTNYERLTLYLPKGDRENLHKACEKYGIPASTMATELLYAFSGIESDRGYDERVIRRLINDYFERQYSEKSGEPK